jgi:hypothetical protein
MRDGCRPGALLPISPFYGDVVAGRDQWLTYTPTLIAVAADPPDGSIT